MNLPEETLRAYIESVWTLATEGVTSSDIAFTLADYNTERSPQAPHIIVYTMGFRRIQPAESVLYEFTFLVQVSVFPKWRKLKADIGTLQGLYWEVVNHIKIKLDAGIPTGWEWAYVETGANAGIAMGTIPNEYVFNLTVKACIPWST